MKIYLTESIKNYDSFTDYLGTDKESAIKAGRIAWQSLSTYDKKKTVIEVQEWEISDDIDVSDSDAIYDAIFETLGYDIVTSFSYKENESC